jgi:hypothetical protein
MPGDVDYSYEKYAHAASLLAASHATLRERLEAATLEAMHGTPRHAGAGPPVSQELTDRIVDFQAQMNTRSAVGTEGTLAATIARMTDEELEDAAEELIMIALELAEESGKSHA